MPEWLNGTVSKTVKDVSPSRVRIPVSPQNKKKPENTTSIGRFPYFKLRRSIYLVFSTYALDN